MEHALKVLELFCHLRSHFRDAEILFDDARIMHVPPSYCVCIKPFQSWMSLDQSHDIQALAVDLQSLPLPNQPLEIIIEHMESEKQLKFNADGQNEI
jgi:hypothetical protein